LADDIREVRIQTGFFSIDGIAPFIQTLAKCKEENFPVKIVIGSNDASTLKDDMINLANILGVPRDSVQLGVVSFGNAYFHPKTFHFRRDDGTQAAFVGSANLTASGLALHVEAGIALDTRDGDAPQHLEEIASAIDYWFTGQRTGITVITESNIIDTLAENGVLALVPPPRPNTQTGSGNSGSKPLRPRLKRLFDFPQVQTDGGSQQQTEETQGGQQTPPILDSNLPVEKRTGFPDYILFEPSATEPTDGESAITGTVLPSGAVGLIIQLNKDSARHFMGGDGTANISIPVDTVATLRFGVMGKHSRPAGMFRIYWRYISDDGILGNGVKHTSLMGYGFTKKESGHGDIRLVVPAAVRNMGEAVIKAGRDLPTSGDLALLEWPTQHDPFFRLSCIDRTSQYYQQVDNIFRIAENSNNLVGDCACWLPDGFSPTW
jgi:hypothetical protein